MSQKEVRPNFKDIESHVLFQLHQDTSKILCVDEHPVKPWIATAHDNSLVKIWDYEQKKLIQSYNLDRSDDSKKTWSPIAQPKSMEKLGIIHSIRFFDTDTQKHAYSSAQQLAARDGQSLPNQKPNFYLCNWIVVSAENKIVFLNYVTQRQIELKLSDLDGKAQNCVAPIGVGPLIAFGGVDGVIRVWDTDTQSVLHRLCTQSGHKSVQHIVTAVGSKGESILVSAGIEGGLFWWKDFSDSPVSKKSLSEILDLSYNPITGDIITTSSDKSVAWWNIATSDHEGQVKSLKTVYSRVSRFSHPRFPFHSILACTNDSKVFVINKDSKATELLDLAEMNGSKKVRIYELRSHPCIPSLLFCCTRTSLFVLSIAPNCTPSFALTEMKERKAGSRRRGKKLVQIDVTSRLSISSFKRKGKSKAQTQKLSSTSYVKLGASHTGRYLSVFTPQEQHYLILDMHNHDKSTSNFGVIDEGKARDVAWFGSRDQDNYCIIGFKTEETEEKVKKSRLITVTNKKITVEKHIQDLQMATIDDNGKVILKEIPSISNCDVKSLHGGLLMGFHLDAALHNPILDIERSINKKASSASLRGKKKTLSIADLEQKELSTDSCLRWVYELGEKDTTQLDVPNPLWMAWDPLEQHLLLVFPNHFSIFGLRPSLVPLYHEKLSITSAIWYKNALIYVTNSSIECKFLGLMSLTIASSDPEVALNLADQYDGTSIIDHLLPMGSITLIEVTDDIVYVLDSLSTVHSIPITSPQIRFYFLASTQPKNALQLVDSFPVYQHHQLAQFLCYKGFSKEAVLIPSLSYMAKARICHKEKLHDIVLDFIPGLIVEAQTENKIDVALQLIRNICADIENEALVTSILTHAVELDETLEKEIILNIVALSSKKTSQQKLKSYYEELVQNNKYESAVFAAQFIDPVTLSSAAKECNFADFVQLPSNVNNEEVLAQFRDSLIADQKQIHSELEPHPSV